MRLPPVVHSRVQALLLIGPPTFGVTLGGIIVGGPRLLVGASGPDLVVPLVLAALAAVALAVFVIGAVRVRRGAHTYFPRLWRVVPWTAAGGFVVGSVVAGVRVLLGYY